SQQVLLELREGATHVHPEWSPPGSDPERVRLTGRATASIEVDGEPREVAVLVARGEGVELTVIDDDAWPLVLRRVEGANYWRLLGIDYAELGDGENEEDDDLPAPELAGPLASTGPLTADEFVAVAQRLGVAGLAMDHRGSSFF